MKKQKGRKEVMVNFPKASLVSVEPPSSKAEVYALPTEMMDEEDQYPLFDSSGRVWFYIFENKIPLSNFFWGGGGVLIICQNCLSYRYLNDKNDSMKFPMHSVLCYFFTVECSS